PEIHDRVDGVVGGDEVHDLWNRVTRLGAGEVDRVVSAPPWRELGVDGRSQVVGEPEQLETGARHGVSRHDSPPARSREHGDARAPRSGWVANVAAASKASSSVIGRVAPA